MKIVKLEQNTPEWLQWRRGGVGGSDIATLMHANPWSTPYKLWRHRVGMDQDPVMNEHMKRGHDLEPVARKRYNEKTGRNFQPCLLEHTLLPFLRVSLDGMNIFKGIEIKCPTQKSHDKIVSDGIPLHYMWQMRYQMMVGDLEEMDFISFDGKSLHIVPVPRETKFDDEMKWECAKFWECVVTKKSPPKTDKDYSTLSVYQKNWK